MAGAATKPLDQRTLLWGGEIGRLVLGFSVIALLARLVSPDVLGIYLSITSLALIVPRLLDCGLPHAFGYFLRSEPESLRSSSGVLARHVAVVAPLALAVAFAFRFVPFANDAVAEVAADHWVQLALFMVSELATLLGLSSFVPTARFKAYVVTALTPPSLLLISVVLWPRADLTAGRLLDLLLATSLAGSSIMAVSLYRAGRQQYGKSFSAMAAYTYGIRSYGAAAAKVAAQRFDRMFLVTVLGTVGYAQYSLAVSIRDMAVVPANLYAMTLRNHQIDLIARDGNLAGARKLLLRVSLRWTVLAVVGAVVMYPFWPMLARLLFGAKLEEAAVFLKIVAFSCAPLAIMGYAWNHLYAMKLPGRVTMLTVLSLLAALPMFALFIHWRGPSGGVAAAVVAWSALAAIASLACAMVSRLPAAADTTTP